MSRKALEQLGQAIRNLSKALGWLVPVVALVVALVFIFRGQPDPTAGQPPEQLISRYIAFAIPYLPPATTLPTEAVWNDLLAFFSSADRKWLHEHRDALAWLGMAQDDRAFQQADERARRHAAFRLLIGEGPTQHLTVQQTLFRDDPKKALVKASSLTRRYEFPVVQEGEVWKFEGVWGLSEQFATPIAQFTTRYGTR